MTECDRYRCHKRPEFWIQTRYHNGVKVITWLCRHHAERLALTVLHKHGEYQSRALVRAA